MPSIRYNSAVYSVIPAAHSENSVAATPVIIGVNFSAAVASFPADRETNQANLNAQRPV